MPISQWYERLLHTTPEEQRIRQAVSLERAEIVRYLEAKMDQCGCGQRFTNGFCPKCSGFREIVKMITERYTKE